MQSYNSKKTPFSKIIIFFLQHSYFMSKACWCDFLLMMVVLLKTRDNIHREKKPIGQNWSWCASWSGWVDFACQLWDLTICVRCNSLMSWTWQVLCMTCQSWMTWLHYQASFDSIKPHIDNIFSHFYPDIVFWYSMMQDYFTLLLTIKQ